MKHTKKILALIIAMVMMMGAMSMVVFGAAGEATPDASITISGLDTGDQVQFFQVLKWQDNTGWVLTDNFTALLTDDVNFPSQLAPTGYQSAERMEEVVAAIVDGISMEEAQAIAKAAKGQTADYTETLTGTATSASYTVDTNAKAGLYMAVIGAIDPEVTYLPVFASADFKADNTTNAIDASKATHIPASGDAVAKKSRNHVDKTTKDTTSSIATAIDSKVGMLVDFYVDTVIPVYFDCYDPSYQIDDSISDGIDLEAGTVKVYLDNVLATDVQCTVTEDTATNSYSVVFKPDYLLENKKPVNVHIEYQGTVTRAADFNVNEDDNTVTVTYKNGPTNGAAALRDKTNHYTFSIGADAFGADQPRGSTYELIKVAADKDGKPIFSETNVQTWEGAIRRHPLESATFKLYTDSNCTTPYSNSYYPNGAEFTTGSSGIITFKGLEAGTYYLLETDAPDGYIKSNRAVEIVIEATYKNVTVPARTEGNVRYAAYDVEVLDSYSVKVNGGYVKNGDAYTFSSDEVINTYTFDTSETKIINMSHTFNGYADSDIINTPGVELPSTGGMGTTLFYIIGAVLVLGAGILLVTRKRMAAN